MFATALGAAATTLRISAGIFNIALVHSTVANAAAEANVADADVDFNATASTIIAVIDVIVFVIIFAFVSGRQNRGSGGGISGGEDCAEHLPSRR